MADTNLLTHILAVLASWRRMLLGTLCRGREGSGCLLLTALGTVLGG